MSAFHYGAPVGFGWIREQAGGPVRVLAVGPALAGAAEGGQVVLSTVLRHLSVFEEAHRLLRQPAGAAGGAAAHAVEMFAGLITTRSATCGPDCRAVPCTLRQIHTARRAAIYDPRITLWAELSVLAHLTGWTMPMPGPAFATALAGTEARLRDCAVSHAVDDAVASRAPVISARVGGPALSVHVAEAMHAALDGGRWLCDTHEPQWLAPPYRWVLVLDSLRTLHRREPGAGPHPRTAEWEETYALNAFRNCRWPLDHLPSAGAGP